MGALNCQVSRFTTVSSSQGVFAPRGLGQYKWFREIPPERVGLRGEYDHYGLQKRVEATLSHHFSEDAIARLIIRQRGRVIVLHGRVPSPDLLQAIINLIYEVDGIGQVELRGVDIDTDIPSCPGAAIACA